MKHIRSFAALAVGILLTACASVPDDQSVAEYCAAPGNGTDAICKLNVEVDGNTTAIADTKLSVEEARAIAAAARASADDASSAAARAQSTADDAMSMASRALSEGDLDCMTNTINKSDIGTCPSGYTVMGCTQTRYTTAAGRLSFLREVNNDQCRFASRVLEMDVRCCRANGAAVSGEAGADS